MQNDLEALSVHDGRTGVLVLGLGDPHGLESSESGKDGSSNPHGVLTLGRSDDLDAHGRRCKGSDLLGETLPGIRADSQASIQSFFVTYTIRNVYCVLRTVSSPRSKKKSQKWPDLHLRLHHLIRNEDVFSHHFMRHQVRVWMIFRISYLHLVWNQ